jgi:GNAT superfamily N-acetyltransferase
MNFVQASSSEEIEQARELFEEYAAWLQIDLCFQSFDKELAGLPGQYAPPDGRLLLAIEDDQLVGCVALRKIGEGTCEMKRLFLRSQFRGQGSGRKLAETIIAEARQIGYERMRLDTLPGRMDQAIKLYRALGFQEIPAYYHNPVEGATFMELLL